MTNPATAGQVQGSDVVCFPARDIGTDNPTFFAPQQVAAASIALAAVLNAADLAAARAAARAGLDRLVAYAPSHILEVKEAAEIAGKKACTIRRWAKKHRLGRKLGGEWILFRDRFDAFVAGGS